MLFASCSPRCDLVWKSTAAKYLITINEASGANTSSTGSRHDSISEADSKTRFGPTNSSSWHKGCDPKAVESRNQQQPSLFAGPVDSSSLGVNTNPGHSSNGRHLLPETGPTGSGSNLLFRESVSRFTNRNMNTSSGNGHNSDGKLSITNDRASGVRSNSINHDSNWRSDHRPSDRSDFSRSNSKHDYDSGRGRGNSTSSMYPPRNNHGHNDRHHDRHGGDRHGHHDNRHSHHNNGHSYYEEPTPEWMDEPTEKYEMMDLGGFEDDTRGASPQPSTSQSDSPSNSTNSNRTDESEPKVDQTNGLNKGQASAPMASPDEYDSPEFDLMLENMLKFTEDDSSEIPIQHQQESPSSTVIGSKSSKWFASPNEVNLVPTSLHAMMMMNQQPSQPPPTGGRSLRGTGQAGPFPPTSSMVPHQVLLRQQGSSVAQGNSQSQMYSKLNRPSDQHSMMQMQHQQPNIQVHQLQVHHHHQQQQPQLQNKIAHHQSSMGKAGDLLRLIQTNLQQPQPQHSMYGQAPPPMAPVAVMNQPDRETAILQQQLAMQQQQIQMQHIQAQRQQQQQQQPQPHMAQRVVLTGQGNTSDQTQLLIARLMNQSTDRGGPHSHLPGHSQSSRPPFMPQNPNSLNPPTHAKSLDEVERSFQSSTSSQPVNMNPFKSAAATLQPMAAPGQANESNSDEKVAFDRLMTKLAAYKVVPK